MKMDCKRFIGLLGIFLAFGLVFVACGDGDGNSGGNGGNVPDPTVNPIEAAFTNMLKDNFVVNYPDITDVETITKMSYWGQTNVETITKMSYWGQTNSEYTINGTEGFILYILPSSFGTVPVMSGGVILMTGPDASIVWGEPTGDTSYIEYNDFLLIDDGFFSIEIASGSNAKITYPYAVSYPSGSDVQIKGKLNLNLSKGGVFTPPGGGGGGSATAPPKPPRPPNPEPEPEDEVEE